MSIHLYIRIDSFDLHCCRCHSICTNKCTTNSNGMGDGQSCIWKNAESVESTTDMWGEFWGRMCTLSCQSLSSRYRDGHRRIATNTRSLLWGVLAQAHHQTRVYARTTVPGSAWADSYSLLPWTYGKKCEGLGVGDDGMVATWTRCHVEAEWW